jgi:hypothetical protein
MNIHYYNLWSNTLNNIFIIIVFDEWDT